VSTSSSVSAASACRVDAVTPEAAKAYFLAASSSGLAV